MRSSHLTWRHTCVVLDFEEGRVAMWENGRKYFEKTGIADLPATYERNRKEIDIVSAGCVHKAGVTPMMSIHGKVTIVDLSNIVITIIIIIITIKIMIIIIITIIIIIIMVKFARPV